MKFWKASRGMWRQDYWFPLYSLQKKPYGGLTELSLRNPSLGCRGKFEVLSREICDILSLCCQIPHPYTRFSLTHTTPSVTVTLYESPHWV